MCLCVCAYVHAYKRLPHFAHLHRDFVPASYKFISSLCYFSLVASGRTCTLLMPFSGFLLPSWSAFALRQSDCPCLLQLIDAKADLDAAEAGGATPLFIAASNSNGSSSHFTHFECLFVISCLNVYS